jgi:uncharacterized protein
MKIPYEQLDPDTLQNLIEDFVTRDGTDYGLLELSQQEKVQQVGCALKSSKANIVYDKETETCNILLTEQPEKI